MTKQYKTIQGADYAALSHWFSISGGNEAIEVRQHTIIYDGIGACDSIKVSIRGAANKQAISLVGRYTPKNWQGKVSIVDNKGNQIYTCVID